MRLSSFLATLGLLCGLAASAAVSVMVGDGDGTLIDPSYIELRAPKLERPPPGHMKRKRDSGEMFTFGGYQSSITGEGNFKKLEEPIEANGHPHPWCQGFEGSNGYTDWQEPTIHVAHMDKAKNESDPPGVPQHICWFYNNFDCDPSKGSTPNNKYNTTHAHITDLSKKYNTTDDTEANRNLPLDNKDVAGHRYLWIKAYGCMFYVDTPAASEVPGTDRQQGPVQGDVLGDTYLGDLAKRAFSWFGL